MEIPHWAIKESDETHAVSFRFGKYHAGVRAVVNSSRFPRLKISHQETPLRVSGTVESISEMDVIVLRDIAIEFLPNDKA